AGQTINVYCNFTTLATGTLAAGAGSTVAFRGILSQAVVNILGTGNYQNVIIDKTGGMVSPLCDLTIEGNLTVSAGTYSPGGYISTVNGNVTNSATVSIPSGTFVVLGSYDATSGATTFTGSGRLRLKGDCVYLGTFTKGTGTVEYNDTANPRNVRPVNYYNLQINNGPQTATLVGTTTATNVTITTGTLATAANSIAVSGNTSIPAGATLKVDAGSFDANGPFTCNGAGGGVVRFDGNGLLELSSTVASLNISPNPATGTVKYNYTGGDHDVLVTNAAAPHYHHLEIDTGTRVASVPAALTMAGNLTVTSGTFAVGDIDALTVTGSTSVAAGAYLTVSTGRVDANGSFGASGFVQLTAVGGRLYLGGTVSSLGTFSAASGSIVRYDSTASDQSVQSVSYAHLEVQNSGGFTATAGGNFTVSGELRIDPASAGAARFSVGSATVTATGTATINGGGTASTLIIDSGIFDANGPFISNAGAVEFTPAGGGTLKLSNGSPTFSGTFTAGNGKVVYDDTTAGQAVRVLAYYNLEIAKNTQTATTD
ncbi:MAG: hypothetical protein RDV41_01660, partial [Planctomycetota bacterium]|nr:hypothetical protein [Planctomycetota bacterium]